MEWTRAFEAERTALVRLAGLLATLAAIAERAADRSVATRGFVLWLLRFAERIARDFVLCDADWLPPEAEPLAPFLALEPLGDSRAEALRLAAVFQALAFVLDVEAARLTMPGGDVFADGHPRSTRHAGPGPLALRAVAALSGLLSLAVRGPPAFDRS